jgi:hypothetical protein
MEFMYRIFGEAKEWLSDPRHKGGSAEGYREVTTEDVWDSSVEEKYGRERTDMPDLVWRIPKFGSARKTSEEGTYKVERKEGMDTRTASESETYYLDLVRAQDEIRRRIAIALKLDPGSDIVISEDLDPEDVKEAFKDQLLMEIEEPEWKFFGEEKVKLSPDSEIDYADIVARKAMKELKVALEGVSALFDWTIGVDGSLDIARNITSINAFLEFEWSNIEDSKQEEALVRVEMAKEKYAKALRFIKRRQAEARARYTDALARFRLAEKITTEVYNKYKVAEDDAEKVPNERNKGVFESAKREYFETITQLKEAKKRLETSRFELERWAVEETDREQSDITGALLSTVFGDGETKAGDIRKLDIFRLIDIALENRVIFSRLQMDEAARRNEIKLARELVIKLRLAGFFQDLMDFQATGKTKGFNYGPEVIWTLFDPSLDEKERTAFFTGVVAGMNLGRETEKTVKETIFAVIKLATAVNEMETAGNNLEKIALKVENTSEFSPGYPQVVLDKLKAESDYERRKAEVNQAMIELFDVMDASLDPAPAEGLDALSEDKKCADIQAAINRDMAEEYQSQQKMFLQAVKGPGKHDDLINKLNSLSEMDKNNEKLFGKEFRLEYSEIKAPRENPFKRIIGWIKREKAPEVFYEIRLFNPRGEEIAPDKNGFFNVDGKHVYKISYDAEMKA